MGVKKCWLDRGALSMMVDTGAGKFPMETGGLLMGYWAKDTPVVTHVIGAGPNAKHSRYNFEPDYEYQNAAVSEFYDSHECKLTYLGDWHTHPCGPAEPSTTDRRAIQNIRDCKEAFAPKPLMLILGNHLDQLGIYCLDSDTLEPLGVETFNYSGQE